MEAYTAATFCIENGSLVCNLEKLKFRPSNPAAVILP